MKTATTAETKKVADEPKINHIHPASELAIIVNTLWKPVYVPIAVAVSFLSAMLLIQALATLSVAAAYRPYKKNNP